MKKVFAFMAVVTAVCTFSCKKGDPTPAPADKPVEATITAADVTVEEGATVQVNATTNSSAAIVFTPDNSGVYTIANGVITGERSGEGNLKLSVAAVEGKFTAAEKTIKVTVTAKSVVPEPPTPGAAIVIDGNFDDWGALEAGKFAKAVNDPGSPWEAVDEIRCFAKDDMVYYYIKYNAEYLAELLENPKEVLPLRLCINTDDEFESGYTSYFLEGYDFIVEGDLAENGAFVEFDGTFFQRIDGKWVELAGEGKGLVCGMGTGSEFEIALDRKLFNEFAATSEIPMAMGDHFQTGIRFYFINEFEKWDELSNMPNSDIDEEMGNGYGYLMRVKFN